MSTELRKSSRCRHMSERAKESISLTTADKRHSRTEINHAPRPVQSKMRTRSDQKIITDHSAKTRTRSRGLKRSAGETSDNSKAKTNAAKTRKVEQAAVEPVAVEPVVAETPAQSPQILQPKALVIQTGEIEFDDNDDELFQRPFMLRRSHMKEERRRRLLALREMQMLNSVESSMSSSESEVELEDNNVFDYRSNAVFSDDEEESAVEPLDSLLKQFSTANEEDGNIMAMPVASPLSDYPEDFNSVQYGYEMSDKITRLLKENDRWPLAQSANSSSFDILSGKKISPPSFPSRVNAPVPVSSIADQQQQSSMIEDYFVENDQDEVDEDDTPSLVSDKSRSSSPTLEATSDLLFSRYPHQLEYRYHGQANLALVDPEQIDFVNNNQPMLRKALNKRSLISGSAYTQLVGSSVIEISDFLL
ncbi:unnamed protein product [Kuraishia capsulata CBS 1993]|uniref:Uncharacterized protein n=1 Tax=Kuraishia capsulata CBS 1993 TaxID=1382522 RepID=W6ML58_9ASCO|nr:uncharacterized protein KUCA_T00002807001 [Kuraishia capsulata CBS 1993]CDK26833.1 unnamed protein product [Kuraishia capsulata CBS 1993]